MNKKLIENTINQLKKNYNSASNNPTVFLKNLLRVRFKDVKKERASFRESWKISNANSLLTKSIRACSFKGQLSFKKQFISLIIHVTFWHKFMTWPINATKILFYRPLPSRDKKGPGYKNTYIIIQIIYQVKKLFYLTWTFNLKLI